MEQVEMCQIALRMCLSFRLPSNLQFNGFSPGWERAVTQGEGSAPLPGCWSPLGTGVCCCDSWQARGASWDLLNRRILIGIIKMFCMTSKAGDVIWETAL